MQVVDKLAFAPSVCFLCETKPVEGVKAADTGRDFQPVGITPIDGRKYVCEECVNELAKLFGFEKGEAVELAKVELDHARQEISALKDRAKQIAEQILGEQPIEPKVKPVVKRSKEDVEKG